MSITPESEGTANGIGCGEFTRAVHTPVPVPPEQRPVGLPVYRTSSFAFVDSAEYADVLARRRPGYSYGREGNPTVVAFAAAAAALEGYGVASEVTGAAFASGMAASTTALLALSRAGAHVVAPRQLYGGTYAALHGLLDRFGVTADYVDIGDLDAVRRALRPQTALVWAETIANPTLTVADLPSLGRIAAEAGVPLVVDSTFATPAVCRPLALGADLVVHSATKFLGGHSDVLGGLVLGAPELVAAVAATRAILGGTLSPDDAFLLHRGLATLPLRMARHSASARLVAQALAALTTVETPLVREVSYPGLAGAGGSAAQRNHALAEQLFAPDRFGGMVSIVVPGGRAGAAAVCDAVRLAMVASSLGGAHTMLSPVATTTHRQLDDAALASAGIDPGMIRISVGLEDPTESHRRPHGCPGIGGGTSSVGPVTSAVPSPPERRLRVAVVFGGRSTEHAISCISAGSILESVDRDRYDVLAIGITTDGRWVLAPDDPKKLAASGRHLPAVDPAGQGVALLGDPTARGLLSLDRPMGGICPRLAAWTWCFPCCTARSGRTAPSRACWSWPASRTWAPACWPAPRRWTRST